MPSSKSLIPAGYADWLSGLKSQIASARQRAALTVNQELVRLYHRIGSEILERQTRQGWGAKVIDRLASDLREAFPDMKGFSGSNLKYMRFFAQQCPNGLIGQQPADQLPWFHLVTLLTKVSVEAEREWYATQAIAQGWSRGTLDLHIKNRLHVRKAAAVKTSTANCLLPMPKSQPRRSKTPTSSIVLGLVTKPRRGILKTLSSGISPVFFSSWAEALRSSGVNSVSK